jgi:uncharacterized protein YjdB
VGITLGTAGTDGEARRLSISGPRQVMVGQAITLTAVVFNGNGDSVFGAPVTWANSNPEVARLEATGSVAHVTGLAVGATSIEALSDELMDSIVVTVGEVGAPVATIEVVPPSLTLSVGDSVGLQAVLRDAIGNVLADRPVSWSLDSSVVQTLGQFGHNLLIRAVGKGTALVRALAEGKQGSATVTVQ